MTDLELQASQLEAKVENASHAERIRLQPQVDRVVTTLAMQGYTVPNRLRTINNTLKDEVLDDMFDNMPV
ncbi:hypothetical protein [Roseobacter weihaiensis]|uniref:hypothetical protein n=1 Tax=Roseobacter weihaiensis TaxID=2763262 RepID=UPI001D0A0669|nr:hypothetical protein [Roseobacter sp. H9]